jgi:hypothetical protein
MEEADLRRRVAQILEEEERPDVDWPRVEALCEALNELLRDEPESPCPDAIFHYFDYPDLRQRDEAYALTQRDWARRYVETGERVEHAPGIAVPWWGCLLALGIPLALLLWLLI